MDTHCGGVVVRLTDGRSVIVRETDSCAFRVVDRATTRLKRVAKERMRKRRDLRRGRDTIRRWRPESARDDGGAAQAA